MLQHFAGQRLTALCMCQGGGSRTDATDIICPMYARIDECVSFANIPTEHRPVIQCEYAHAMGNSNGNYKVCSPLLAKVTLAYATQHLHCNAGVTY